MRPDPLTRIKQLGKATQIVIAYSAFGTSRGMGMGMGMGIKGLLHSTPGKQENCDSPGGQLPGVKTQVRRPASNPVPCDLAAI